MLPSVTLAPGAPICHLESRQSAIRDFSNIYVPRRGAQSND